MQQVPSMKGIADQCFQELEDLKSRTDGLDTVPDELLLRLNHLCGKNWLTALRIVDESGVTCFIASTSGRHVFRKSVSTQTPSFSAGCWQVCCGSLHRVPGPLLLLPGVLLRGRSQAGFTLLQASTGGSAGNDPGEVPLISHHGFADGTDADG